MALSPEILVPRLGEVLINEKLITEQQLDQALNEQKRISSEGGWTPIGEILVRMGFISRNSLDQAITSQIQNFQQALLESNQTLEKRVAERTSELEIAYKKLSELDTLKSNFISNISHELRTPLTHIKGYIELFLEDNNVDSIPEWKQGLEVMHHSTERLKNLIDDLIMFSSAETGSLEIAPQSFNVKETIEIAVSRQERFAEHKNISLILDCPYDSVFITADQKRIVWVINQFIENAIKFTPSNGVVVVHIRVSSDEATISIEDTGIGLTETQSREVFMPFHQLDGDANRAQGGTGIGLALAKRIIEAHGSEIKLHTKPGHGSKFEFTLPLTP